MIDYNYIIVDTKLLSYKQFHSRKNIVSMIDNLVFILKRNKISFRNSRIIFAHDIYKSKYRLKLWSKYKLTRKLRQDKEDTKSKKRRELFLEDYKKLPNLLQYIGTNCLIKDIEADDVPTIVQHLFPNSKILLVSLDADWLLYLNSNTHILYFTKNILVDTKEKANKLLGVDIELYPHIVAIGSQAKDNIINLKQLGEKRFIKYCTKDGKLKDDYGSIIDELVSNRKHGIELNSNTKYKNWRDNYLLNLQLMSPIPITEINHKELDIFKNSIESKLPYITYKDFLFNALDMYDDIPEILEEDFNNLR